MTAQSNPQDYRSAVQADPRTIDTIMARAPEEVINALAARWTNWRIELGFENGGDQ